MNMDVDLDIDIDSKMLEYGPGTIYAGAPSSRGFGVGEQSYSNCLASTVLSYTIKELRLRAGYAPQ